MKIFAVITTFTAVLRAMYYSKSCNLNLRLLVVLLSKNLLI